MEKTPTSRRNFLKKTVFTAGLAALMPDASGEIAAIRMPRTINNQNSHPLKYINYFIENGSPLFYDIKEDGSVLVSLVYDHERNSPNRAAGHWNFQVLAGKDSRIKMVLQNFNNVWNSRPSSPVNNLTPCYISVDGEKWDVLKTNLTRENSLEIDLIMPGESVYLARLEPYRISELERFKSGIKTHSLVRIEEIGKTVENRPLEIIQVGNTDAPHRLLLRGRSHPWEPGGNWVIEGVVNKLLKNEPEVNEFLGNYCVYILPMINKDGVAHGRTRFNLQGMDLNRNWDKPADPVLAPENAALERWLKQHMDKGLRPDLAIDFHNDSGGRLHISRPDIPDIDKYLRKMKKFEDLLIEHTWFTEGSTGSQFRNPGTFGEGLLERFGIDALVYELNANWIAGLNKVPFAEDWKLLGQQLCRVFDLYFSERK